MSLVTLIFLFFFVHWVTDKKQFTNPIGCTSNKPPIPDCVVLKMEDATCTAQCVHKQGGSITLQLTQHCLAVLLLCYDTFTVQHKGENNE